MNPETMDNQAREGGGGTSPSGLPSASGATNPDRGAIVALFRVGTRKARLAAALMLVVTGLLTQTANQALAEARQAVLYLDAPAVSTDRATNAGEVARAYSDPRSPTSPDVLAWLGVRTAAENDTRTPPKYAAAAFASITAVDADGTPAITAEAAYEAGETMLAQIEDGVPSKGGSPSEDDLAAAGGAVRPELGEDTQAPDEKPAKSYEAPPTEQPSSPDLASSPEPVAEPDGAEGLALQAPAATPSSGPAETELAAVPSEDASPTRGSPHGAEPGYGATGPVSESAAGPSVGPADESEAQKPEVQKGDVREPGDGGEFAGVEHAPAASQAPAHHTGRGGEAAQSDPAASSGPANEVAYEEPAQSPDTGPTSTPSDDVGPAPISSPPAANGVTTEGPSADDLASASPAPAGSGEDDAPAEDTSERPVSEVVIVQGPRPGEGDDASEAPEEAALAEPSDTPADAEGPREESTPEPRPEPQPEDQDSLPTGEPSGESLAAEEPIADEGAPTASAPPDAPADGGSAGASETTSPSPTDESSGDPAVAPTDQTVDESIGDQQGATPTDEPASPVPDEGAAAQDVTPSRDDVRSGQPDAEQSPGPGNESTPLLTAEPDAEGQTPQVETPERQSRDRGDDRLSRRDRGGSDTILPDERIERVEQGEGGAEVVQETSIRGSGDGRRSVTGFRDERSPGSNAPELPDATAPSADEGSAPRKVAQEDPQNVLKNYGLDLDASGLTGSNRAGKEATVRGERGRQTEDATPDDVDEESSEGSQPTSYLIRAVDPTDGARSYDENRAKRQAARQERIACRQQIAAAGRADRMADRRAERREARRANIFAARVAERHAERRANRIAAARAERRAERQAVGEQAAIERAAIRHQRRQNRLAAGGVFDAERTSARVRGRNAPAYQEPAARPRAVKPVPVRQVGTQHSAPAAQPPGLRVPLARLDPAPRVQSLVQPEVQVQPQQRVAPGGARMPESVDRATGR
jgi:hypothetical protein